MLEAPGSGQPREWREELGRVEEKGGVKGGARRVGEEAEGRSTKEASSAAFPERSRDWHALQWSREQTSAESRIT